MSMKNYWLIFICTYLIQNLTLTRKRFGTPIHETKTHPSLINSSLIKKNDVQKKILIVPIVIINSQEEKLSSCL